MRKIRRLLIRLILNLYIGLDVFVIYPLLLLLLPSRIPYRLMRLRGDLMYRLSGKTRARVIRALEQRLPGDYTDGQIRELARRYFWIQNAFLFDTYYIAIRYRRKWASRFVTMVGKEHLDRSLEKGKGVIAPTLHLPHPLHTPGYLLYCGYPVTGFAVHPWDLKVPFTAKINAWLGYHVPQLRLPLTMAWSNRGGARVFRERLRENDIFIVLLDAFLPERKNLVTVEFLGKPTVFPSRITEVVYETGSPVHVITTARSDDADWRKVTVTVSPELEMTGDHETDMQVIVKELERRIVASPGQWWGWAGMERTSPEFYERYRRKDQSNAGGGANE
jgi:lauroyl/myristoyl acyltransferase